MRFDFKRVVDLAIIVVLAGGAAACFRQGIASHSPRREQLYVQGASSHVSDRRLARIARPYLAHSFFNIDTAGLQHRLNGLAWLHNVTVARRWPNGVLIQLHAYHAVAHWKKGALLAANGHLFRPVDQSHTHDLPRLSGPSGSQAHVFAVYQRLSAITGSHHWRLVSLHQTSRGAWRAQLGDGLRLRLGQRHLTKRMHRFVDYADASSGVRAQLAHAGYVDLRYANGFAVGGSRAPQSSKEQTG